MLAELPFSTVILPEWRVQLCSRVLDSRRLGLGCAPPCERDKRDMVDRQSEEQGKNGPELLSLPVWRSSKNQRKEPLSFFTPSLPSLPSPYFIFSFPLSLGSAFCLGGGHFSVPLPIFSLFLSSQGPRPCAVCPSRQQQDKGRCGSE